MAHHQEQTQCENNNVDPQQEDNYYFDLFVNNGLGLMNPCQGIENAGMMRFARIRWIHDNDSYEEQVYREIKVEINEYETGEEIDEEIDDYGEVIGESTDESDEDVGEESDESDDEFDKVIGETTDESDDEFGEEEVGEEIGEETDSEDEDEFDGQTDIFSDEDSDEEDDEIYGGHRSILTIISLVSTIIASTILNLSVH